MAHTRPPRPAATDPDTGQQMGSLVARNRSVGIYVIVAFGWAWTAWFVGLSRAGEDAARDGLGPWLLIATAGPLLGAVAAAVSEHGPSGARLVLRSLFPLRHGWRTWLLAFYVFVPAAVLMAVVFGFRDPGSALVQAGLLVLVPIVGLTTIVWGPLGEEWGWRGLLLPFLLQRMAPVPASVVLGVVWAVWHAPLFGVDAAGSGLAVGVYVPLYVVSLVAISLVMTFVFLRTGGSVGVAILLHAIANAVILPFGALQDAGVITTSVAYPYIASLVLTAVVVVASGGLRPQQAADRAVDVAP